MIRFLRLSHRFDTERLQYEMGLLEEDWWKQHYNKQYYEGGWNVLPLRSINGNPDNIISIHSHGGDFNQYSNTSLLNRCIYIRSVMDWFDCEKTSVRLMNLRPGSIIKAHRDHEMSFEDGEVRFHIPVITNGGVEFMLGNEPVLMEEGECWYLNFSLEHSVKNGGNTDRIHLVIDCKVNEWIKELFNNQYDVIKDGEPETAKEYNNEDRRKIIEQLRIMNTVTSHQLADQMEAAL